MKAFSLIRPGRYEAVALVDPEARTSRGKGTEFYNAHFVILAGPGPLGTVISQPLAMGPGMFLWQEAAEHPGDLHGERVYIDVLTETWADEERNRVRRVLPIEVPETINRYGRTYRLEAR